MAFDSALITLLITLLAGFLGWWGTNHYNKVKERSSELANLEAEILVNLELLNKLPKTRLFLREDGWNDFRKRGGSKLVDAKCEDFAKCYSLLWEINEKIKDKNTSNDDFEKIKRI